MIILLPSIYTSTMANVISLFNVSQGHNVDGVTVLLSIIKARSIAGLKVLQQQNNSIYKYSNLLELSSALFSSLQLQLF